jgi:hypothetical protein
MGCLSSTVLLVAVAAGLLLLPYDSMLREGFQRVDTTHISEVRQSNPPPTGGGGVKR